MCNTYIVKPAETLAHDWLKRNIKGEVNNHIAEQNLQSKQQIHWDRDSAICIKFSTDHYQGLTLQSWFH